MLDNKIILDLNNDSYYQKLNQLNKDMLKLLQPFNNPRYITVNGVWVDGEGNIQKS